MRVRVVKVAANDAYYRTFGEVLVGHTGEFEIAYEYGKGWFSGILHFDTVPVVNGIELYPEAVFNKVKLEIIDKVPARHVGLFGTAISTLRVLLHTVKR